MSEIGDIDAIMSHHHPPNYASNAYQNRSECEHINGNHYERHEHESRGPMCSHCSGGYCGHRLGCSAGHADHGCGLGDHSCRGVCQPRPRSSSRSRSRRRILRDLGDVLDSRRQNNEISILLDDVLHQSQGNNHRGSNDNENNEHRSILSQIIEDLIGNGGHNSNGRHHSLTNRSHSTDRDVLVDLLLRIHTSTDQHSTIERYIPLDAHRRRIFEDIIIDPHFFDIQQAWMASNPFASPYPSMMDFDPGLGSVSPQAGMPMTIPASLRLPGSCRRRNYAITGPFPTSATPVAMWYARNGMAPPTWLGRLNGRI